MTGDCIVKFKAMFELVVDVLSCCSHCRKADTKTTAMTDNVRRSITQLWQQIVYHLTTVIGMD